MPKAVLFVVLIISLSALPGCGPTYALRRDAQVRYNVFTSHAELRQNLLRFTPLGSSQASVISFLKKELKAQGELPDSIERNVQVQDDAQSHLEHPITPVTARARTFIWALFPSYTASAAIMFGVPLQHDVYAKCFFDADARLIEIEVANDAVGF